ncbi:hypothetical protein [Candidatus Regiella insecticola]|uniref:hypothetical protein n=1 Tax=Candidatus Regiella insecticola TaxID=138073 RepID=UPI00159DDCBC|nr:hypothetical protein [Candidatus Regiella insecticola]
MNFKLQRRGQGVRKMSVDILRDSGEHPQPTTQRLERQRVYLIYGKPWILSS